MNLLHLRSPALVCITLAALALAACGDGHDDDDHDDLSPEEEACLHANDPPENVTAAASPEGNLATLDETHVHYRVALAATDDPPTQYVGSVAFTPYRQGRFALFTSTAVPVTIVDASEQTVNLSTTPVELCVEIAEGHAAQFRAETYVVTFGPTTEQELSVVIEFADDGHNH
jgi:hypothetical protein